MDTDNNRYRVWLMDESRFATVRRVETHPAHGKQFLVTTYSRMWGPETYWTKEENVRELEDDGGLPMGTVEV